MTETQPNASSSNETQPNASSSNETVHENWPGCNPDAMLAELNKLTASESGFNNRPFFKTYVVYRNLSHEQKNKAHVYFDRLTDEKKAQLVRIVQTSTNEEVTVTRERAEQVHKNDLARLLHLR